MYDANASSITYRIQENHIMNRPMPAHTTFRFPVQIVGMLDEIVRWLESQRPPNSWGPHASRTSALISMICEMHERLMEDRKKTEEKEARKLGKNGKKIVQKKGKVQK
jgi:hypothetical protein